MNSLQRRTTTLLLITLLLTTFVPRASSYSVLSHEQVVDLLWGNTIVPILHHKFPAATEDDLRRAHAYAYGGCIIQDMGYYPFGSEDFSNLTHYVRSGDFVRALLDDAQTIDEYAFALGALAHYAADTEGHPAVNKAVADEIPSLKKRYGNSVTYAEDKKAHIRVEFGFDIAQVARQRFAPESYHDFIGFEVSKPLLERAFKETYGMELGDVFKSVDLSIGSYRRAVSKAIPMFTRAALATHHAQLVKEVPNFNKKKFLYEMKRAQYEKTWGKEYERPGFGARVLAFLFHLVPKVGPFKAVDFKTPTAQTEDLYFRSMNQTVERYRAELNAVGDAKLELPNRDFDTGKETKPGEYSLTDETYAKLLDKLAQKKFQTMPDAMGNDLLRFYADTEAPFADKKNQKKWRKTLDQISALKSSFHPAEIPVAASGQIQAR